MPAGDHVWSTAGDVVAGASAVTHPSSVDVWSISTGKRQRVHLTATQRLLTAVPGGVAVAVGDGVDLRSTSGQLMAGARRLPDTR